MHRVFAIVLALALGLMPLPGRKKQIADAEWSNVPMSLQEWHEIPDDEAVRASWSD